VSDDGFLAEIAAAPDEPAPYLIYADALMLRGDPRGDLISIQHALETAPPTIAADLRRRESEILERNLDAWLGLSPTDRTACTVRWRFGFVHAARITDASALRALFAAPAVAQTLAEIRIGQLPDDGDDDDWDSYQDVLDAVPWHPALRRLHVTDGDLRGLHVAAPVRIPEQAKQLDTLVVQSPQLQLAWDATPVKLRALELRCPNLVAQPLLAIREWPNLESLVVWTEDAAPILRLLSKLPRLRHLGLCGSSRLDMSQLVSHPIMKQLTSLDLRGGTLTVTKPLQAIAAKVKLDVRFNLIGKEARTQLAAFGADVRGQRRGKLALTDRNTLFIEHDRVRSAAEDGGGTQKSYAKLLARTPDPAWLFESRHSIASDFEGRDKRDALAALVRECAALLVDAGDASLFDIYYTLGETCDALVEGFEAETWLWQCVNAARWVGETTAVRALGLIGTTRMRRGDPVHAAAIMDRVLAHYLEHGSENEQAWAYRQRGNVDLVRSEYTTAEGYYRKALEIYRKRKQRDDEGIVLSELAGVLWSRQDFDGAVAMIRESISTKPEGALGLGSSYYNLGAVLNGMGKLEEAREAGLESLAIFRKHQRRDGEGQALSLLGELAQRSNRHDEAQEMLEEAMACHRERGAIRESGVTLGNLARVALDRADYKRARAYAEEAVELHRECANKYNEGMQLLDSADAMIGQRRLDDALAFTEEAMIPLVAINNLPGLAAAKGRRAYVAHLRGNFDEAERHYDEAIADAKTGNYPEQVGWTQIYRAVLRAQQGRHDDARALVEEARPYLADSLQGMRTVRMTEAVIARLADGKAELPAPGAFDEHLIASFAR
jgi:uncharacterized protein (TIGR02996 family)